MKDYAENTCLHEQFDTHAAIHRMAESEDGPIENYSVEFKVSCKQCGQPFRFKGVPVGLSFARPMMSPNGEELRCPIEPSDDTLQSNGARIEMPEGKGTLQ